MWLDVASEVEELVIEPWRECWEVELAVLVWVSSARHGLVCWENVSRMAERRSESLVSWVAVFVLVLCDDL